MSSFQWNNSFESIHRQYQSILTAMIAIAFKLYSRRAV